MLAGNDKMSSGHLPTFRDFDLFFLLGFERTLKSLNSGLELDQYTGDLVDR